MSIKNLLGKTIHIEGPDFTGKTTLCKELVPFFTEQGIDVDHRFQPGATELGKECRRLLFDEPFSKNMDLMAERMLFTIDHADFVNDVAKNRFTKEKLILCDRYNPMSNIIYGVNGRGLLLWDIQELNRMAMRGIKPDLIVILGITEETMIERMKVRMEENENINKLDLEGLDFKRRILYGYENIHYFMKEHADIIVRVDANGSKESVFTNTINVICDKFDITL